MATRATRELPIAACLVLLGVAMFFGDAAGNGMLPWLGGGALLAILALLYGRGVPRGALSLVPLAALVAWLALSIWWSALPDRSWDYADRTLVYLLFAVLGLWLAARTRELAYGLAALLGAVVVWSLGSKVLPFGSPPVIGIQSRLDAPVGLWNQLALLGDFALPLALWLAGRRRAAGTLLAYAWAVAIVLTLSRSGLIVAVLVVGAWLVFTDERWGAAITIVAAGLPAGAAAAVAFALPGVTSGDQTDATRWRDGLVFGAVLIAGAAAALGLARLPQPRTSPALRRALLSLAALAAAAIVVAGVLEGGSAWRSFTSSGSVGNQGPRASFSSNFRWIWWQQAWHGWEHHRLAGTGAGSFNVSNLRYRTSYLDFTSEPHDLPVQFLSEAGVVGLLLFGAAALMLLRAGHARRGHELALALMLPAYLVHGLGDIDWDFVAVSAPAFVAAGALAGGSPLRPRLSGFAALLAGGAALLAFSALVLPWLGERWALDALTATNPSHQISLAKRARSVDPLLVEPDWAEAEAQTDPNEALAFYAAATRRQPENARTWLSKADFELSFGCAHRALPDYERFNALDPYARPTEGPNAYRRALRLVNSGRASC